MFLEVTVYSKPACVQCTATKTWLKSKNIDYVDGDVIENVEHIKALTGFLQAPVIKVVDTKTQTVKFWSGHNPFELDKLLITS